MIWSLLAIFFWKKSSGSNFGTANREIFSFLKNFLAGGRYTVFTPTRATIAAAAAAPSKGAFRALAAASSYIASATMRIHGVGPWMSTISTRTDWLHRARIDRPAERDARRLGRSAGGRKVEAWRTAAALALVWLALLRLVELSTCARRVSKQLVGRAQVTPGSRRDRTTTASPCGPTTIPRQGSEPRSR